MSLFGDEPVGKPAKVKRTKAVPAVIDGSVQRCIDTFFLLFVKKWNSPAIARQWADADAGARKALRAITPELHGGKHGKRFKNLISQWGEEAVLEVEAEFFLSFDQQVTRTDYGFDAFFRLAQHLRLRRTEQPNARQRTNMDAAAKFLGRKS